MLSCNSSVLLSTKYTKGKKSFISAVALGWQPKLTRSPKHFPVAFRIAEIGYSQADGLAEVGRLITVRLLANLLLCRHFILKPCPVIKHCNLLGDFGVRHVGLYLTNGLQMSSR